MTYELYYSDGGHGGPYPTFMDALTGATSHILGRKHSGKHLRIEIRPRESSGAIGGYGEHNLGSTYVSRSEGRYVSFDIVQK